MKALVVCAVEAEAECCRSLRHAEVVAGGVGRTNAAVATTRAILERGPFDVVLSVGVAGGLPGIEPSIMPGDVIVGSESVYHEEGLLAPGGFMDMAGLGFSLGPFDGNRVPADPALLRELRDIGLCGPIATVAGCSGTDAAALEVRERTLALAEAMEGAAVLHAAALHRLPAIEIRVVSNTTGARDRQVWDLAGALGVLEATMPAVENGLLRL